MQAANNAPIYAACLYPELSEFMRTKGWALAVHGSLARDFDLVAIPWHPDPVSPKQCVEGICHYWAFKSVGEPETRLHGRLIYTIALKFGKCFLDLSFMPTTPNDVLEHEGLEQEVKRLRREAKANKATAILTRLMDNLNQGYQSSHFDGDTKAMMRQANKFLARPDTEGSKP